MKKFAATAVLTLALIILLGYCPEQTTEACATAPESVYFTINAGSKSYPVTDESLRGGWWNEESQKNFRNGLTVYEKASEAKSKSAIAIIKKDFPDIWHLIKKIQRENEVKSFDGVVVFHPGNTSERFTVEGARKGYDLDEEKLCVDILATLKGGQRDVASDRDVPVITAHIHEIKPRTPDETIAKLGLRGGYTTYFESNPPREYNIGLALSKFNGLTVQNGQTISFNKVVGPRTSERGFEEAKIIMDGEFVPGVGGGVCQSSTTLFNAALLAGLNIDKSYNHSIPISYVPLGRDAMVSSAADLVFTNNTGGTIYIEAGITPANNKVGKAWVKIYGNKTNIKYKPRTEITESDLGKDEIVPARKSNTYVEAWSGDRLVHSKLVRKSRYNAIKKD